MPVKESLPRKHKKQRERSYQYRKRGIKMKRIISTPNAPGAIGPYSQGIAVGNLRFFSGQIPLTATGELISTDITAETRQVMKNIGELLKAEGLTFDDVIKTTVFLKTMDDFKTVNEEYAKYFGETPPARSCVAVCGLPRGCNVEIEVIACKQ